MSFSPSRDNGEWTCNRQPRAPARWPVEEQGHGDGSARAALPSTTVTTRLCEYCTHTTDGECLPLTAPGKGPPHLSYKRGAWGAPQDLCSAVLEGLEAWELHKIMFPCSWRQTRQFYNCQHLFPATYQFGEQIWDLPVPSEMCEQPDLCLPQCLRLSNAVCWNHRVTQLVHGCPTFIVSHPKHLSWIWDTFAMTKLLSRLPITFAIAKDIPKDSSAWLMTPHLSPGPIEGFQHHRGTARRVWFGDPTWDFPVLGFSQSGWTLGHLHGHLWMQGKAGLAAYRTMEGQTSGVPTEAVI